MSTLQAQGKTGGHRIDTEGAGGGQLIVVGADGPAGTLLGHRGKGGGALSSDETLVVAHSLNGHHDRHDATSQTYVPAQADTLTSSGADHLPGRRQEDDGNLVAGTLRSHPRPGSASPGALTAFNVTPEGGQGADLRATEVDVAPAVAPQTGAYDRGIHLASSVGVRRLTPTECERLMGWPDVLTIEGATDADIRAAIQDRRAHAGLPQGSADDLRDVWQYGETGAPPPGHPRPAGSGGDPLPDVPRGAASPARAGGAVHRVRFHLPAQTEAALAHLLPGVPAGKWAPFGPEALGCRARHDGWTAPAGVKAPDTKRYAACGDGVVANVSEWLGRRIIAIEEAQRAAEG